MENKVEKDKNKKLLDEFFNELDKRLRISGDITKFRNQKPPFDE